MMTIFHFLCLHIRLWWACTGWLNLQLFSAKYITRLHLFTCIWFTEIVNYWLLFVELAVLQALASANCQLNSGRHESSFLHEFWSFEITPSLLKAPTYWELVYYHVLTSRHDGSLRLKKSNAILIPTPRQKVGLFPAVVYTYLGACKLTLSWMTQRKMFYTKLVANHDCRRSFRWSLTFGKIYMPIFMFNLLCKQENYFRGIFKRNMIWYHMFIKPSRNSWLSTIIIIIKMMIIIITIKWWWWIIIITIIIIIIRAVNVRALGLVKKRRDQNLGTWDCWSDKLQWAAKDHPPGFGNGTHTKKISVHPKLTASSTKFKDTFKVLKDCVTLRQFRNCG